MVDLDEVGGLQVVVKELLDAGFLDGDCMTCTGETLSEQIRRLNPPKPDGYWVTKPDGSREPHGVVFPIGDPYKENGGLRVLSGNLSPRGGTAIKIAGLEGGVVDGVFAGSARVFNSESALLELLESDPNSLQDRDIIVIRYEGPKGAPGMPELLDSTSRITTICRQRGITIALMTDARFSGGSVGLVMGHVQPEAYDGGPIALLEDGDRIVVDLNRNRLDCLELGDIVIEAARRSKWEIELAESPTGEHPLVRRILEEDRLLQRMRWLAVPALEGAGMRATPVIVPTNTKRSELGVNHGKRKHIRIRSIPGPTKND